MSAAGREDDIIRSLQERKFEIANRPDDGRVLWVRRGGTKLYTQSEALAMRERRAEQKKDSRK